MSRARFCFFESTNFARPNLGLRILDPFLNYGITQSEMKHLPANCR